MSFVTLWVTKDRVAGGVVLVAVGGQGSAWVGAGQGRPAPERTPMTIARRRRWGTPKSAAFRISALDLEARGFGAALELDVLGAAQQLGDVLHHERPRLDRFQRAQVLAPQPAPLEADRLAVQRREALARRPADHHVGRAGRRRRPRSARTPRGRRSSPHRSPPRRDRTRPRRPTGTRRESSNPRVMPPQPAKRSTRVRRLTPHDMHRPRPGGNRAARILLAG